MSEGFRVSSEEIRTHANTVRGFEGRAGTAADAGAHVASLDDAYGVLCQPFGMMVAIPQNRAVDALSRTRETTKQLADNLGAAADAYQEFEQRVVDIVERIGRSVERSGTMPEVGN
jgi:hypothetical protein